MRNNPNKPGRTETCVCTENATGAASLHTTAPELVTTKENKEDFGDLETDLGIETDVVDSTAITATV